MVIARQLNNNMIIIYLEDWIPSLVSVPSSPNLLDPSILPCLRYLHQLLDYYYYYIYFITIHYFEIFIVLKYWDRK